MTVSFFHRLKNYNRGGLFSRFDPKPRKLIPAKKIIPAKTNPLKVLKLRNSKKNRKYLDYIPGTTEFRLRVTEKKLEAMNREECPVRYIFHMDFLVKFPKFWIGLWCGIPPQTNHKLRFEHSLTDGSLSDLRSLL